MDVRVAEVDVWTGYTVQHIAKLPREGKIAGRKFVWPFLADHPGCGLMLDRRQIATGRYQPTDL